MNKKRDFVSDLVFALLIGSVITLFIGVCIFAGFEIMRVVGQ